MLARKGAAVSPADGENRTRIAPDAEASAKGVGKFIKSWAPSTAPEGGERQEWEPVPTWMGCGPVGSMMHSKPMRWLWFLLGLAPERDCWGERGLE